MTLWKGLAEEMSQEQWHIIKSFNGGRSSQEAVGLCSWTVECPREVGREMKEH